VFLVVTNPVESLTQLTIELSGLPASRVLGTGTLIDSLRFRSTLSRHLGIHPDDVRAYVIGEHGELQFPLLSSASTGGVKLDPDDIPPSAMAAAKQAGHIVFESRGYTNFAISQAVVMIVRSIIDDQRRTMPVSTLIENVRGVPQVCLSVPCVVGREGIVRRLLPKLDLGEREQFAACALEVQRIFAAMHAG
jgi:L-lactate dehydrogenase